MVDWSIAVPSFLTALAEWVEAFTIVLAVSLGIVALEFALVRFGFGREAVLLVPAATMAGVAWLAPR